MTIGTILEANRNLISNIDYLKEREGLRTDRELAEILEVAPSMIAGIRNCGNIPTIFPFFKNLINWSGCTFEELMCTKLSDMSMFFNAENAASDDEISKYLGLYVVYYYHTNTSKSPDSQTDADRIDCGLLGIYREQDSDEIRCRAMMCLSSDEAKVVYGKCCEKNNPSILKKDFINFLKDSSVTSALYQGSVIMTHKHIYVMSSSGSKDYFPLILHRQDSTNHPYYGGIGLSVSVSRGFDPCPTAQFIGISRFILNVSSEQIAKYLLIENPALEPDRDLKETLGRVEEMTTETPKKYWTSIIKDALVTDANRIIERKCSHMMKVSIEQDNQWYHLCMEHSDCGSIGSH